MKVTIYVKDASGKDISTDVVTGVPQADGAELPGDVDFLAVAAGLEELMLRDGDCLTVKVESES